MNDRQQRGQPVMVRYADDFVILCAPGQGTALRQRLARWLSARGLKLNEQKTRLANSQEGFEFLGFRVRWQRSRRTGHSYAHVEPRPRSTQRLRDAVRVELNHWTQWRSISETVIRLNRLLKGWSGYFHYRNSSRMMGKTQWWVCNRMRRWLWRKHGCKKALWSDYPDSLLHERYGLWQLPTHVVWR